MKNTSVQFFYPEVSFAFRNRKKLKSFLVMLFKQEGFVLKQLNIIFCTDKALLEMNRKFLKHDYFTDIITFPLSDKKQPIEAELYISVDRIKENARINNETFTRELHRVIFHGCLHLLGYNDKSSQQIKRIRERESHYLRLYFRK